jgi:hypothetical protein
LLHQYGAGTTLRRRDQFLPAELLRTLNEDQGSSLFNSYDELSHGLAAWWAPRIS